MSDNRGIPKYAAEMESELSSFAEHDTLNPRKSCHTIKSSCSMSTVNETQQANLGSLIDECSKGAYSNANRRGPRR